MLTSDRFTFPGSARRACLYMQAGPDILWGFGLHRATVKAFRGPMMRFAQGCFQCSLRAHKIGFQPIAC